MIYLLLTSSYLSEYLMYTGNSSLCITCRSQTVSFVLISLVYNSVCGIQSTEINLDTFKDFCGVPKKKLSRTRGEK